jgi:uncharacterized protein
MVVLGLAWICFTACVRVGQQQTDPWRLFTLSPLPGPEAEAVETTSPEGLVQPSIGVGPIHLPEYLDQDELVTRISPTRITVSENDRWAEPLEDNIAQVLAHNLSIQLRSAPVILQVWPAQERPTYQLEIDVLSFDADTAGTAHLAARWFLRDVRGGHAIAQKETHLTAAAAGQSGERSVASLSKAMGDFSVGIAKVICETVQHCVPQSGTREQETGLLPGGPPRP